MSHSQQFLNNFGIEPPVNPFISLRQKDANPQFPEQETEVPAIFTTIHWEERKYFTSLLIFLSTFSTGSEHVLILGGAPGSFLIPLIDLFPSLTWEIWDSSAAFDNRVAKNRKIWKDKRNFNPRYPYRLPDIAKSDRLFLISFRPEAEINQEAYLKVDPDEAMLYFDLKGQGKMSYLDGTLIYPLWGEQKSSSSFLIPNGKQKNWDVQRYRDQMYSFNLTTRAESYPHTVSANGIDHCFDCSGEVAAWELYSLSTGRVPSDFATSERINYLTKVLSNSSLQAIP
jgi:hypothetical protein